MLPSIADVREGFICPQCHHDMSTMEMLHMHFQDVHMKQPSSTVKGLFSLAKQKIKSVQDNFTINPNEQINSYAQYFSLDSKESPSKSQHNGYSKSFTDKFKEMRKSKQEQVSNQTTVLLLRLEKLTNNEEINSKNINAKERRKYEQTIVDWIDESKVSLCPSCAKPFGLSRRKHHCRLDGYVICDQCSQFLSSSMARYLIEPNKAPINGVTFQGSNSLTSGTGADDLTFHRKDGTNHDDYLRICLSCRHVLQRHYNHIRFNETEKDEIFSHYEKIVEAQKELLNIHPTYSAIIESLLNGDTKHQIVDGQRLYRRISVCFEKIDSTSKYIAKLAESCPSIDENDKPSRIRYSALCRNIRMYAIHLLQNYAISTRRVPSEEEVQRARDERRRLVEERNDFERAAKADLASRVTSVDSPVKSRAEVSGWRPTIDRSILAQTQQLNPLIQQIFQVTEYIRQAQEAGRHDEVASLKNNLKELEQALNNVQLKEDSLIGDSQQ